MSTNNSNQRQFKLMAPQLLKSMGLKKFLEDNEIVEIEEVYDIKRYQIGEDRDGTIIELKEKGSDEKMNTGDGRFYNFKQLSLTKSILKKLFCYNLVLFNKLIS